MSTDPNKIVELVNAEFHPDLLQIAAKPFDLKPMQTQRFLEPSD